jgi:hypothetical protein
LMKLLLYAINQQWGIFAVYPNIAWRFLAFNVDCMFPKETVFVHWKSSRKANRSNSTDSSEGEVYHQRTCMKREWMWERRGVTDILFFSVERNKVSAKREKWTKILRRTLVLEMLRFLGQSRKLSSFVGPKCSLPHSLSCTILV